MACLWIRNTRLYRLNPADPDQMQFWSFTKWVDLAYETAVQFFNSNPEEILPLGD